MNARWLLLVLLWAGPALADGPTSEERALFQHGLDLFARGDVRGAQADFEQVLSTFRRPVVLYNLALVRATLGDSAAAVALLDEVLSVPDSLPAVRLEKARAVRAEHFARLGEVSVLVPVDGAEVKVNGQAVGQTPLARSVRVKAGQVLVAAVAPKHLPAQSSVTVSPGGKAEVRLDLMPLERPLAQLTVRTQTPLAELFVDGVLVGQAPFLSSFAIEAGSRRVELRRSGFRSSSVTLTLAEQGTSHWEADLEEDPLVVDRQGGRLQAQAGPEAIEVTVDGRRRGPLTSLALVPGLHEVRFERGGFHPEVREVDIRPRETTVVELSFEPTPELRASLERGQRLFRTIGYSGLISGAALALAGGAYLVYNLTGIAALDARLVSLQNEKNAIDGQAPCQLARNCDGLIDAAQLSKGDAQRLTALGIVGLSIGVVALGVGGWALLAAPDPGRYDRRRETSLIDALSWSLTPLPGGGAAALGGRF